jgi:hypothetical protein
VYGIKPQADRFVFPVVQAKRPPIFWQNSHAAKRRIRAIGGCWETLATRKQWTLKRLDFVYVWCLRRFLLSGLPDHVPQRLLSRFLAPSSEFITPKAA